MFNINFSIAGQAGDVHGLVIESVYQPDFDNTTTFDIIVKNHTNSCGTRLYRSVSSSEAIANRKFSLVLTAFTSGKKISLYDLGECDYNRSKAGWIRITD